MLRLARECRPVRVVDDQRGSPTWARALAEATLAAVARGAFSTTAPVYHLAGGGDCTWFEFASRIFELAELSVDLTPIPTAAYPTPAKRPAYSVLSCDRAFHDLGIRLPHWEESLRLADPASIS
jgi:dTDP-4-dehydrorhamnose reductase